MNVATPPKSPLLDHCPESLPASAYYDPDWYAREQALIWAREWVCVGRHDTQDPGTLRPLTIGGQPVMIARAPDGTYAAFLNTCRHRGAALCLQDGQPYNGRLITCPYHAWAYDAGGRLVSTAHGTPTGDFDKADHGLFPVHLKLFQGTLYVCLAETPPAFAPDPGPETLANWRMETLVTGHVKEVDLACNWKIFWENYNECLHCPTVHPQLIDMVPIYAKGIMSPEEQAGWSPENAAPAPLKEGARTWSATGQPCGPEFPHLTPEERAAGHTFLTHYPSVFWAAHVDYIRMIRVIPTGPETTRLRAEWLFLPETLAQPGFDIEAVTAFAATVLREDGAACEMNQKGLRAGRFRAGRLMPQEFDIFRFHNWIRDRMTA